MSKLMKEVEELSQVLRTEGKELTFYHRPYGKVAVFNHDTGEEYEVDEIHFSRITPEARMWFLKGVSLTLYSVKGIICEIIESEGKLIARCWER